MEKNELSCEKINIPEGFVADICKLENRSAGKLIKLIYRNIFLNQCPKEEYKDVIDVIFWASKEDIDNLKNPKKGKKQEKSITFYSWYVELFNLLNDEKAGLLFKKFADEALQTNYLKGKKYPEIDVYYDKIQQIGTRKNKEKAAKQRAEKRDFTKIENDFPLITWQNFNQKDKIYQGIDCIKLYKFIEEHPNLQQRHIEEIAESYWLSKGIDPSEM